MQLFPKLSSVVSFQFTATVFAIILLFMTLSINDSWYWVFSVSIEGHVLNVTFSYYAECHFSEFWYYADLPLWQLVSKLISYYDISLFYSYCTKTWRQNYLWVDLNLKTTPPPIFLDPVSSSDQPYFCTIWRRHFDMNKLLRNLTPFRHHVLLLYSA